MSLPCSCRPMTPGAEPPNAFLIEHLSICFIEFLRARAWIGGLLIAALTFEPSGISEEGYSSRLLPHEPPIHFLCAQFQGARDPRDEQASAEPEEEEAHLCARGQQTPPVAGRRGGGAKGQMQLCCSGERTKTNQQWGHEFNLAKHSRKQQQKSL